jgi:hypothetical protein
MKLRSYLTGIAMIFAFVSTEQGNAAGIETLVMPGKVIAGHAELESECSSCHVAFDRDQQRALCLDCHEDVAKDIKSASGFHGLFDDATDNECANCHTDHKGRGADIVALDEGTFEHDFTDFELLGGHDDAACDDCHVTNTKFRDAPRDCLSCHEEDNVHADFLGVTCSDCHTPLAWPDVEFDHDGTGYPLLGKHEDAACLDCHEDQTFQSAPATCYGCHAEDDSHNGRSGQECENCHKPSDWADTSFDHDRDTRFPLDGQHSEQTCDGCHSDDPFADELEPDCVSCHLEDDVHEGNFGQVCETCHGSSDWPNISFDHNIDTNHALVGAHESIECASCHIEPIYEVSLQPDCNSCHLEDDAHEGEQGITCNDCHNETSWQDDVFFDHDLTLFPLLGTHASTECASCHESHVFRDAPEACVDCHLSEDPHKGRYSSNCATCHNPVSWVEWQFDHNTQSDFLLDGAHLAVDCVDCHRQPLSSMAKAGSRCIDCHRSDDIHDGDFGGDCGRCHSADSFNDVRSLK